jgi:hypothetical protein
MPPQSEQLMIVPPGFDAERAEQFRRRIERFEERQLAARARTIEAQRRMRLFAGGIILVLALAAATSAFVAWSLGQLKASVAAQLESATAAITASKSAIADSNRRWQEARQALVENRAAMESNERLLVRLRAETRAGLLLPYVDSYLAQIEGPADPKLKENVQAALVRQLMERPDTPDSQLISRIEQIVRRSQPTPR